MTTTTTHGLAIVLTDLFSLMRCIENIPARKILELIIVLSQEKTPSEIEQFVRIYFDEEWFSDTTDSLRGSDCALRHTIRSIRSELGITMSKKSCGRGRCLINYRPIF